MRARTAGDDMTRWLPTNSAAHNAIAITGSIELLPVSPRKLRQSHTHLVVSAIALSKASGQLIPFHIADRSGVIPRQEDKDDVSISCNDCSRFGDRFRPCGN